MIQHLKLKRAVQNQKNSCCAGIAGYIGLSVTRTRVIFSKMKEMRLSVIGSTETIDLNNPPNLSAVFLNRENSR